MFQIKMNYGQAVIPLPAVPADVLARASAADLRVLIAVCTPGAVPVADSLDAYAAALGARGVGSEAQILASLAFWRGAGVLELSEDTGPAVTVSPAKEIPPPSVAPAEMPAEADADVDEPSPATVIRRARGFEKLPRYNSKELGDMMEARQEIKENLDECARIWGDILTIPEANVLLGLSDYLGLDWDYILSLVARCVEEHKRHGAKPSMRYVEKMALTYYDEEIRTLHDLEDKFRAQDALRSLEGKLRTLFGMGERRLTPKETKFFSAWAHDFHYDFDIIQKAYEVTVDIKGKPNLNYINSVLSNWDRDHLRTVEEIEAHMAVHRAEQAQKPAPKAQPSGSFDTDNFFDAAVRRNLGEDFNPD